MAGALPDVTDNTFQAEVLESETPVLVDFWAPWCGPCRVVGPVLEEIQAERDDLRIVKLNTDENPETAAAFQVLSIPTMILFKGGAPAKKIIGAYPKRKLEAELEPILAASGRQRRSGSARTPSNRIPSRRSLRRAFSGSPRAVGAIDPSAFSTR
jgi:thioredoxin 1